MNRRLAIRNLLAASAGSFFHSLWGADAPDSKPADAESNYVLRSDVRLVLLDVSVKDTRGGFVSGLSKENFTVLENGRPQQITHDLESFWATTYKEVKKELQGRYPKHAWPDDPWTARPQGRPGKPR